MSSKKEDSYHGTVTYSSELNAAVEQGDLEIVKSLVEQSGTVNINSVPWGMESVLMRALRCQHKEVAKYLIEKGVDIGYHYTSKEFDDDIPVAEKFKSSAREYAEFYKLPEIVTLIDQKTGRIQDAKSNDDKDISAEYSKSNENIEQWISEDHKDHDISGENPKQT